MSPRWVRTVRRNPDTDRRSTASSKCRRTPSKYSVSWRVASAVRRGAVAAGNPRAVRAVGSACSHNPVPVVVPCHRVVRSDGTIGRYLGGTDAKVALLALEAA